MSGLVKTGTQACLTDLRPHCRKSWKITRIEQLIKKTLREQPKWDAMLFDFRNILWLAGAACVTAARNQRGLSHRLRPACKTVEPVS